MKKKMLNLGLAMVLVTGLLTGCLSNESPQKEPEQAETPAPADEEEKVVDSKDSRVIKVSNGASNTSPVVIAEMEVFKTMVEEGTEGRYTVEIYHSAQLGDDTKSTEGVRDGSIEMVVTSPAPLVGFCSELAVLDIPFLFTDASIADTVLDGELGQYLSEKLQERGLVNLAWAEFGYRNLSNSVKDVRTPEDLNGLKIRTMDNKIHLASWELYGAIPTPMSFAELFTALQQKAVDGQENPIATIYSSRFFEVNKHISLTEHIYSPLAMLINEDLWNSISPEDQQVFLDAAYATALRSRELNRAEEENYLSEMEEEGCIITRLTKEEKAVFQELSIPVWDMVEEKVGPELIKMLKDAIAEAEAAQ